MQFMKTTVNAPQNAAASQVATKYDLSIGKVGAMSSLSDFGMDNPPYGTI